MALIFSQLLLSSPEFDNGSELPIESTCEGAEAFPELEWSNIPENTESFAITVEDPDAPDPAHPKMTWDHLILFNISKDQTGLTHNLEDLPSGVRFGLNGWGEFKYGGACPPIGEHRYIFTLYALRGEINDHISQKSQILNRINHLLIEKSVLIGKYQKKKKNQLIQN